MQPGVYEQIITEELDRRLAGERPECVETAPLPPSDNAEVLAHHIHQLALLALRNTEPDGRLSVANHIAAAIGTLAPQSVDTTDQIPAPGRMLRSVVRATGLPGPVRWPTRPGTPLTESALLINGREGLSVGPELKLELASADRVDLICAFIKWSGLRILEGELAEFTRRGGRLRIITTTYLGATDQRALERLAGLGAEIRISYETMSTRLHAKAWLFHRKTNFSTGYIGSSNMSKAALLDGLEWNVRLSQVAQPHLLDTFEATFETYWNDVTFESYDPVRDEERLREALRQESSGPSDLPLEVTSLDVAPRPYQQEILERLDAERVIHNRWRSLVVMATGTGKTVVSALDYRRLKEQGTVKSLLFVAHRDTLLKQARSTFRHVLRDGSFGELYVGGQIPSEWRHVFASVQSLHGALDRLDPEQFDAVIVDEFHHAEAATYQRLLGHFRPKMLLGLTATPERTDGLDIARWVDATPIDLRLWEALERGLLAPFQYFGLHDDTDLSGIGWRTGGYEPGELTELYIAHEARAQLILQAVQDKVGDLGSMRGLGFCVSIRHAEFMAEQFAKAGIPSEAVTSHTADRDRALRDLRDRRLNMLFTVDLFNEGIDLPGIDTVLFLRPTESATVFLQQLGRGLRHAPGKACLTVLDFIGKQRDDFRFDLRFRALTGSSRREVEDDIAQGFPRLPAGCHINLDREVSQIVLANVKRSLRLQRATLAAELRALGARVTLGEFLDEAGLTPAEFYRAGAGDWTALRRTVGHDEHPATDDDRPLAAAIARMTHLDDPVRLDFFGELLGRRDRPSIEELSPVELRLLAMLHANITAGKAPDTAMGDTLLRLWEAPARRLEITQLCATLRDRLSRLTLALPGVPVHLHAQYKKDEALAAFGLDRPANVREGVRFVQGYQADLFFVTIDKSDGTFTPSMMYADRALSPTLFQWESQSTLRAAAPTARRYIEHEARGSSVHLFLRHNGRKDGNLGAPPFLYAGRMSYVSHENERPVRILWRLEHALPADVFHFAKVTAG
ncbi:DUF3427 domain-containing protein [Longispora sp. K20-0274]|uniref:DUF3427 domain-containing protein n=1 Tax=Longispora sp. K20-0274 TaxID=3088255 RepID=UPI003999A41C